MPSVQQRTIIKSNKIIGTASLNGWNVASGSQQRQRLTCWRHIVPCTIQAFKQLSLKNRLPIKATALPPEIRFCELQINMSNLIAGYVGLTRPRP